MLGIWNMGDWLKERLGSAQSMVEWYMEVLELVGFSYVNNSSFPLVIYEYLFLLLCVFYGYPIIFISMVICFLKPWFYERF